MNTQLKKNPQLVKRITSFRMSVFTRHPSYRELKEKLPKLPFKTICRFGSTTIVEDQHTKGGARLEINERQGIINSSSKLLMKKCFNSAKVKTAPWWTFRQSAFLQNDNSDTPTKIEELKFPVIVKSIYGSRGLGNYMCNTLELLQRFVGSHNMNDYIIEKYMTFSREYRLHVTDNGCFYTCRKMLKSDTPEHLRYQRHDDNCSWFIESNPKFDKPINWNALVQDCINAKNALGLDICAFDVKIQSSKDSDGKTRENPEWILIESASAPSMGTITTEMYALELPKIALAKASKLNILKK